MVSQFNLDPLEFSGRPLIGSDEQTIGQVTGVFLGHSDVPKWIAVTCEDHLQHVVPFAQTEVVGPYVRAPYSSQEVFDSATIAPNLYITSDEERRLYHHYRLSEGGPLRPPGPPHKEDPIGPEGAASGSPRFYRFSLPTGGPPFEETLIGPEQPKGPPPDEDRIGPE
jgi:hypothetical protein